MPQPTVHIIPPTEGIFVGSSPNFTCAAKFNDIVDVPLMAIIILVPLGFVKTDGNVIMENYTVYTKTFRFHSVQADHSVVELICQVSFTGNSMFLLPQMKSVHEMYYLQICK